MSRPYLAMLTHTLDGLKAAGAPVEQVALIGGGKSYGEHLGAYKTPAKESDPRFLGPTFYNDQEDLLAARAAQDGFTFTVLRRGSDEQAVKKAVAHLLSQLPSGSNATQSA